MSLRFGIGAGRRRTGETKAVGVEQGAGRRWLEQEEDWGEQGCVEQGAGRRWLPPGLRRLPPVSLPWLQLVNVSGGNRS